MGIRREESEDFKKAHKDGFIYDILRNYKDRDIETKYSIFIINVYLK